MTCGHELPTSPARLSPVAFHPTQYEWDVLLRGLVAGEHLLSGSVLSAWRCRTHPEGQYNTLDSGTFRKLTEGTWIQLLVMTVKSPVFSKIFVSRLRRLNWPRVACDGRQLGTGAAMDGRGWCVCPVARHSVCTHTDHSSSSSTANLIQSPCLRAMK